MHLHCPQFYLEGFLLVPVIGGLAQMDAYNKLADTIRQRSAQVERWLEQTEIKKSVVYETELKAQKRLLDDLIVVMKRIDHEAIGASVAVPKCDEEAIALGPTRG